MVAAGAGGAGPGGAVASEPALCLASALLVVLFDEGVTLRANSPLPSPDSAGRGPTAAARYGRLESLDGTLRRCLLYSPVGWLLAHLALQFLLRATQRSVTFYSVAHRHYLL